MNWYKISQNIVQQYQDIFNQAASIQIIGTGQNEMITIPGGNLTISARELLEKVKMNIASILVQNNVREIDTTPIYDPKAQGLAISHEPGKIHIDVKKIFENAKKSLPSTVQLDGLETDPDAVNGLIQRVSEWLEGELTETLAHESQHALSYSELVRQGEPFTSVQEYPAEQFGRQVRQRFFPRNLPY